MIRVPWIGVDLDGTWANGAAPECKIYPFPIGPEIPETRRIVDRLLKTGELWIDGSIVASGIKKVKCFTARACEERSYEMVKEWLTKVGLPDMEITNAKDFDMVWCLDDRAITMIPGTGCPLAIPHWDYSSFVKSHTQG